MKLIAKRVRVLYQTLRGIWIYPRGGERKTSTTIVFIQDRRYNFFFFFIFSQAFFCPVSLYDLLDHGSRRPLNDSHDTFDDALAGTLAGDGLASQIELPH